MPETTFFDWFLIVVLLGHIPAVFFFGIVASSSLWVSWNEEHGHDTIYKKALWLYAAVIIPSLLLGIGAVSAYKWIYNFGFSL